MLNKMELIEKAGEELKPVSFVQILAQVGGGQSDRSRLENHVQGMQSEPIHTPWYNLKRNFAWKHLPPHSQLPVQYAHRLPIGLESIIRNVPAATVKDFYDRWYWPQHMAVVVVGDVSDHQLVLAELKEHMEPCQPHSTQPCPAIPRSSLHSALLVGVQARPSCIAARLCKARGCAG